ncbi:phage/plasmid primase, P4 family [Sphingobium xenophagum]|nr:phage/plasmid primase, P4 family [Sphingobium xenophagum]
MTVQPQAAAFELPKAWREPYDLGFSVIPIEHGGKLPSVKWKAYQTARAPIEVVRQWAARPSNIGIATGAVSGLLVLDLDSAEAIAEAERRGIPDTVTVRTGKGRHVYFQHPGGTLTNRAGLLPGWDIRGDGGYVVAPGSVHESGATYAWENPPGLFPIAPLPEWLAAMLAKPEREQPDNVRPFPTDRTGPWAEAALRNELAVLMGAPEGRRNKALNDAALKLGQIVAGGHLNEGEVKRRLHTTAAAIGLDPEEIGPTIESGFAKGMTEPRDPPERPERQETPKRREKNTDVSEDQIAVAFTESHGDRLKFDHHAGKWFEWTGTRWQRNETKVAFHYARKLAVKISGGDPSFSRSSVANGAEAFARADPMHAVTADVWDRDPYLIGTPGGTVDLRTGAFFPARQADMITKQTGVAPEHGEPSLWLTFLEQATAGDRELMRFLQQMAGYCLTGLTNEHALFFIYGPGGNGKSVFLNVLNYIMGDYATTAGMDTFTASKSDRHPTDLAMLNGARLVSASETEEGRAWAESRIKQLTGGDKISARFMRQDFFEFVPQFKLVIVGNHAPVLANVDDAAKRRFNIVPFTQKPERPDRQLEEKLRQEAGRILAWAIAGCKDWQANGLVRPEIVTAATADYFEDQDLFGQWIEERCDRAPGKWEMPTPLYNDWADFAKAAGDDPGSQRAMSSRLARAGFHRKKSNGIRAYHGLALKPRAAYHD